MLKKMSKKIISAVLVMATLSGSLSSSFITPGVYASDAAAEQTGTESPVKEDEGKYISDVYIAYGKTEKEACDWLIKNGWEPIKGSNNFDAGKAYEKSIGVAMGIKRTDDAKKAVTDMAVMNMSGGYSIPAYEQVIDEKRDEIEDFIYSFMPVIDEYRENFNNEECVGHQRAELAYEMLNKLYDGGVGEKYPANDTGMPLGDLFLEPLRIEGGGESGGDLEQIILESTAPAVLAVETALAFAADPSDDTWLDRLQLLTDEELAENIELYVPETEGQDIAPSAVMNYYWQTYGDAAEMLCDQWTDIHEKMLSYEKFNTDHDLLKHEDESDEDYDERYKAAVDELKEAEEKKSDEDAGELEDYFDNGSLYVGLYSIPYQGEWGDTLGDFFNPQGDAAYAEDPDSFLPMAVALSEGQRSALAQLTLEALLGIGFSDEEGIEKYLPDIDEVLDGMDSISVYSGSNRGIFRGMVAMTTEAVSELQKGEIPDGIWSFKGALNITFWSTLIIGGVLTLVGGGILVRACRMRNTGLEGLPPKTNVKEAEDTLASAQSNLADFERHKAGWLSNKLREKPGMSKITAEFEYQEVVESLNEDVGQKNAIFKDKLENYKREVDRIKKQNKELEVEFRKSKSRVSTAGWIVMGIGIALLVASIIVKAVQLYNYYEQKEAYYHRDFTAIPLMIVDKHDIISYVSDDDGTMQRSISFDQYAFYEAVRCNRQEIGDISGWQNGVKDYLKEGCGDVADLNADHGKEWLALYLVKSPEKGRPVLADSLKLQYGGSSDTPEGTTKALHYLGGTHAADLADLAYCYKNDKGKMYFFWDEDKSAEGSQK